MIYHGSPINKGYIHVELCQGELTALINGNTYNLDKYINLDTLYKE